MVALAYLLPMQFTSYKKEIKSYGRLDCRSVIQSRGKKGVLEQGIEKENTSNGVINSDNHKT